MGAETVSIGKVLIVDDQAMVREFCGRILSRHGVDVIEAGDGLEAIEIYAATSPDMVLLDVMMPELDGLRTLHELRRIDPEVRVVMISGNTHTALVMKALALGAKDYVVKPFLSGRLIEAVKRQLPRAAEARPVTGGVG